MSQMLSISKRATGSVIRTGVRVRMGRALNGIEAAGPELLQALPLEAKTNGADGSLAEWGRGGEHCPGSETRPGLSRSSGPQQEALASERCGYSTFLSLGGQVMYSGSILQEQFYSEPKENSICFRSKKWGRGREMK